MQSGFTVSVPQRVSSAHWLATPRLRPGHAPCCVNRGTSDGRDWPRSCCYERPFAQGNYSNDNELKMMQKTLTLPQGAVLPVLITVEARLISS